MSATIIRGVFSTAMQSSKWSVGIPHPWASVHTAGFSLGCECDTLLWCPSYRLKSGIRPFPEQVLDPYFAPWTYLFRCYISSVSGI